MPYYEYEYMLQDIKEIQAAEEKRQKEQEKEQRAMEHKYSPKNISIPKMPTVNIPKF